MSIFSKFFGSKSASAAKEHPSEDHKGFSITPCPEKGEGGYRIKAKIEKEIDGEMRSHVMIRADTVATEEEASTASLFKAKILIDQMGGRMFD